MTKLKCWISFKDWKTYININKSELDKIEFNSDLNTCFLLEGKELENFPCKKLNQTDYGKIKTTRQMYEDYGDRY